MHRLHGYLSHCGVLCCAETEAAFSGNTQAGEQRFPTQAMLKMSLKDALGHREVETTENVIQSRGVREGWKLEASWHSWGIEYVSM